jgi:hypothetical protein
MTLKTLKPKVSISLILDDEFLRYCELNKIEDTEKFAREVFNRGFTVVKYGDKPPDVKPIKKEEKPPVVPSSPETRQIVVPHRYPEANAPIKKEIEKDNIYDE